MRKIAQIAGLAWMALSALGGAVLWVSETIAWIGGSSNRGLIYLAFGAALPGLLLYRWGRGPHQSSAPTRELVEKAYPFKTAHEMGHVMQMKQGDPQSSQDKYVGEAAGSKRT
jgi:hypothetical protein